MALISVEMATHSSWHCQSPHVAGAFKRPAAARVWKSKWWILMIKQAAAWCLQLRGDGRRHQTENPFTDRRILKGPSGAAVKSPALLTEYIKQQSRSSANHSKQFLQADSYTLIINVCVCVLASLTNTSTRISVSPETLTNVLLIALLLDRYKENCNSLTDH